jgi:type II secretory pathway pseudopilin PulG
LRNAERGIALLEVLAAITILSIAGLSLVELVAQGTATAATERAREAEQMDEDRLLTATTLLTRSDLDIRIGSRSVGPYVVTVARPERTLYRIAVGRETAPGVEDLVTVVFRAVPQ